MRKVISLLFLLAMLTGCTSIEDVSLNSGESEAVEVVKEEDELVENRGIDGSYYIDITLGLESRGFSEHIVKESKLLECMYVESMNCKHPSTGVEMTCDIYYEEASQEVISAEFNILNLNGVENDTFLELATNFLTYCVSMPYDKSDTNIAKKFIVDNINSVGSREEGVKIVIGDARIELYGNTLNSGIHGMRMLIISKAEE